MGPPDAIICVNEAFEHDNNPNKINFGVGAYGDDQVKLFIILVYISFNVYLLG
jgi:aspartate/tyrosine/aromatic aminotransferase